MLEYAVVKKDNVYKTVLLTDLPGYLEQGFEEVKEFILVRTTSTDLTSADGFAYKAVPVGIDPSVVRVENMAPADMGKAPDEVEPLPEDAIMLGINDPLPEEMQKEIEESQQEDEESAPPVTVESAPPSPLEIANADTAEPQSTVIIGESEEVIAPAPEAEVVAEEVKPVEAPKIEVPAATVEPAAPEVVVETPAETLPVEAPVTLTEPTPEVKTEVATPEATPEVKTEVTEPAPEVKVEEATPAKIEEIAPELNEEPKA